MIGAMADHCIGLWDMDTSACYDPSLSLFRWDICVLQPSGSTLLAGCVAGCWLGLLGDWAY